MKILITGAGGAIGVHVTRKLLEEGHDLVLVDSFRHKGCCDRLLALLPAKLLDRATVVVHDLAAPFTARQVAKYFHGVKVIVNLASLSDVQASIDDPVPFITNNTALILNMLELARQLPLAQFIQFSTDEVYGPCAPHGEGHAEWSRIAPSNPYSASKAAQEAICIAYWRSYGVPLIITNTMNNFGESQGSSKYPALIQKKVKAGEKVAVHCASGGNIGSRFYIHSAITAEAVLHIIENIPAVLHRPGEIDYPLRFNIVGDIRLDNYELAAIIAELMDKPLKAELVNFHEENPGHDLHYGLDGSAFAATGFKPSAPFIEMMKRTIEWQEQHPEWMD